VGIIVLGAVAHRIGAGVMVYTSERAIWLAAGYGAQAFGGVLVAIGLFGQRDRWVVAGAALAFAGLVAAAGAYGPGAALQIAVVIALFAIVVSVYRRASREYDTPREQVNTSVLTVDQAQNFAEQKIELFGASDPSQVSVSQDNDGRWRVEMFDQTHQVSPMTEPEWQAWLKDHRVRPAGPEAGVRS
jgi:hypothetical protein